MPDVEAQLKLLRAPFPAEAINKLPKQVRKGDQDRGKCVRGSSYSADGVFCGGYHARSVHIDFVGHAALTDRLLTVDPFWTWKPLATDDSGLPKFDSNGGLWIELTIAGITRLGYGDADGKTGGNAIKEAIGDALRNAGMRFGAALDLWHKGDLPTVVEESANDVIPNVAEDDRPEDHTDYSILIATSENQDKLREVGHAIVGANIPKSRKDALRRAYDVKMAEFEKAAA